MRKVNSMLVVAVVLAVFAIGNQVLAGQVITVDDDGPADYYTIQDAIDAAVDGDTVVVAYGTYSGEGNRDIDFAGKAITLQSENGPENCIIDCNGTENDPHRGFYFHNDEDANSILDGFTITGGYATATNHFGPIPLPGSTIVPSQPRGGAIYCNNASPTITNCNIIRNIASAPQGEQGRYYQLGLSWYCAGGGIYCFNSSAIINNCIIAENVAENGGQTLGEAVGGAVYCSGNEAATITNCTITGNQALAPIDTVINTNNPLDMAIDGDGYFVLNDGERNVFTRIGAFAVDAAAMLVDPKTGYYVQRIGSAGEADGFQIPGDDNIYIPYDISLPPNPTSTIVVTGNLRAGSSTAAAKEQDGYQPGRLLTVSVNSEGVIIGAFSNGMERDIARIQLALFANPDALEPYNHTYFIPTPASGSPIATAPCDNGAGTILGKHLENIDDGRYAPEGPFVYTGRKLDAAIDGDGYFVLNDGLQNLFTRIGSFDSDVNSMLIDPATGYQVQRIGSVGETDGYQIPGDSNIYISYNAQVPSKPTSTIVVQGNLSADDSYGEKNINILIYDSQGGRHILSAKFVRTEIHTWDLVLTSVTGEIEPLADRRIEGITFNGSDGSYNGLNGIDSFFDVKFPFNPDATQTISFFFGTVGEFDGLTQFAGISTAVAREQDGYISGQLCYVFVNKDGSIFGRFSNGIGRELATIQLALFQNPEYLENLDNGYFVATATSGEPLTTQPGENGAGIIIPKHLEDPNADRYFYQWNIVNTGRRLDMAIEGERYYFVLNDGTQDIFTRIGSFALDADGMLVEPVRGYKVQRIGLVGEADSFQIPGDSNIYISYDMLIPAKSTSKIVAQGNLSADRDEERKICISIYDSQGDSHVLYATFVRTEIPNTWDLVITSVIGEIEPPADRRIAGITFNNLDGSYSGLNGVDPSFDVKFPFNPGAAQTISFFFGTPGQYDGLTQLAGSSTAVAREQDGYTGGTLSSVSVNNEGIIIGSFSNGIKSNIAQIKIATFPAPWALEAIDHGYFVSTATSGAAIATQALSGCAGSIHGGALFYPKVNVPRNGNSFGGGIYCTAPAIIKNCLITDNSSDNGGGIYCQTDTTFENCTISGNSASNTGGGIYCSIIAGPKEPYNLPLPLPNPEDTVITNSILSDNIAERGPQLVLESVGIWLTPTGIGEPDSQFEPDFPGLRVAYSNIQGGEQGVHIKYDDYLVWDQGNIDEYPCFVDVANGDYRLLNDSLCINSGDPNYIPEVNETDLDGNPRVIGGRIDMGTYEALRPLDLLIELSESIDAMTLGKSTANRLLAKLNTALKKLEDDNENNDDAAINLLDAFINAVQAQRGKKISQADADALIAAAQEILELPSY